MAKSRIIQPEVPISELTLTSPWAFFATSEGLVGGTGTSTATASDARATGTGVSYSVTGITQAASAVLAIGTHAIVVDDTVRITGVVGMVEINNLVLEVTAIGATTITVNIASSGFTSYLSGGTVEKCVGMNMNTAITDQWTNKDGWYTGDGTDSCLVSAWDQNETTFDSIFQLNTGAMLIWGACDATATSVGRIFYAGQNNGGGSFFTLGIEILFNGTKLNATIVDDAETKISAATLNTIEDAAEHFWALLIDHRTGVKVMTLYDNVGGAGTMVPGTPKDTSTANSITGGATGANKYMQIGAGRSGGHALNNFLGTTAAASVRRIGVINFGQNLPSNIMNIISDLEASGGVPVRSMQGV